MDILLYLAVSTLAVKSKISAWKTVPLSLLMMIVVEPKGGLCNRMRFIDSAQVLSRTLCRPLTIIWGICSELNCGYALLFKTPDSVRVVEKQKKVASSVVLQRLQFIRDFAMYRLRYRRVIFESRLRRLVGKNYDFTELKNTPSVYIAGCTRFFRPQRKFQTITLAEPVQRIVDATASRFCDHTIGVHIRRTDHSIAVRHSPDQAFIEAMQTEIRQNSKTTFFLATDCEEVESRFLAVFGDRIVRYPREFSRQTAKGVQDALVDLMCLSRTQKIIGSWGSSFSETAAQINDLPLHSIRVE